MADGAAAPPRAARLGGVDDVSASVREPDFESPRVRAAMRMLGITQSDLQGESAGGQRRTEMQQRKRRELLAEVEEMAGGLGDDVAGRLLARDPIAEALEIGRTSGLVSAGRDKKVDEKLVAMREAAKNEVLKIRETEENRLRRLKDAADADERMRARMAEKAKEEKAKRDEAARARDAQMEKKQQVVKAITQKRREEAKELMQKLQTGFERSTDLQKKTVEDWQSKKAERNEKIEAVQLRKEQQDQEMQNDMIQRFMEKQDRTLQREAETQHMHQTQAEDGQATFMERMEHLKKLADEKQAQREDAFSKTIEKLGHAKEVVDQAITERVNSARAESEKRVQQHSARMMAIRKERRDRNKTILDKIKTDTQSFRVVQQREEEKERIREQRDAMLELVNQNQQRLERADEFAREQMLARILKNQARVQGIKEHQQQFQQARRDVLKEFLIEKDHCRDLVARGMKTPRSHPSGEAPASEEK